MVIVNYGPDEQKLVLGMPQNDPNVPPPAGIAAGETIGGPAPAGLTPIEAAQTAAG